VNLKLAAFSLRVQRFVTIPNHLGVIDYPLSIRVATRSDVFEFGSAVDLRTVFAFHPAMDVPIDCLTLQPPSDRFNSV